MIGKSAKTRCVIIDSEFNPITAAGYQQIEAKIEALKADRPHKIQSLAAARALGDLSENAEYSSAKRDLRHLESQLRFLNKQLQYARIVTPTDSDTVEIGNLVTVEFLDDHETVTYQIVGTQEMDVDQNKLSIASPLGKAVLNHHLGETVTVHAPAATFAINIQAVSLPN